MSVSLQQPMRPAEIALVKLANTNEATIAQEIADRIAADTALQNNIDAEATNLKTQLNQTNANLKTEVTNRTTEDSKLKASINEVNGKFPVTTDNIADNAITSNKIADGTINATDLSTGIQNQLSFLASVPDLEFGTSSSFNVPASNYYDCTVKFTAKTKAPIVLCGLQHATGNMTYIVTDVTDQQFNARVFNLTTADITGVTLDWLTISGR